MFVRRTVVLGGEFFNKALGKRIMRVATLALLLGFVLLGCDAGGELGDPPSPPEIITSAGDQSATVSWSKVGDARSYNLYWSTDANATNTTKIANVASPYTHTNLSNGETIYYFVTSINK